MPVLPTFLSCFELVITNLNNRCRISNMEWKILLQVILIGVAIAMDAFAVSVTDGLIYQDITKRKRIFIAATFGIMQGLMPLIGYWIVELIEIIVGEAAGPKAGNILSIIVAWAAFGLLLIIGGHMIYEGICDLRKKEEEKEIKKFSYKEVLLFGVATSIDALGTGVALHAGLSNNWTIFIHISIFALITFAICIVGVFLGDKVKRLFKGRQEITVIIGGVILILLAVWIVISHYTGF